MYDNMKDFKNAIKWSGGFIAIGHSQVFFHRVYSGVGGESFLRPCIVVRWAEKHFDTYTTSISEKVFYGRNCVHKAKAFLRKAEAFAKERGIKIRKNGFTCFPAWEDAIPYEVIKKE